MGPKYTLTKDPTWLGSCRSKIETKLGPRRHLGSSGGTNRSHVLLLPHGGISASLKRGPKVYFGPGPNLVMVLKSKNHNQGGSTPPPGVQWLNSRVTCSSLTPWGISASLKRLPKVYFGPGPNLVMVLKSKNHNQGGSTPPPGVQWLNSQVTCSSLTPWGISASLKRGPKVYFGPEPNLVMVFKSKNHNQGGSTPPPGVQWWN